MDIQRYLDRIKYYKPITITQEVLFDLQKAHLYSIPFENLDIHHSVRITLDTTRIFHKVIVNKRGGICYELNGLFYLLLQELGFDAMMISGKVFSKTTYGKENDHLCILVKIDSKEFLVDVGFGNFSLYPLPFIMGTDLSDEHGVFRFDKLDEDYFRINEKIAGVLNPQYIFKKVSKEFSDFEEMCTFYTTNSCSHFKKKKLISIPIAGGRITLDTENLKITKGRKVQEIQVTDKDQFDEYLWKYFGINLSKS